LALAVAGPVPALAIWAIPAAISVGILRRVPALSPGVVVTITGYAFALLAADALLAAGAGAPAPAFAALVFAAGVVMWSVSFLFANVGFAPSYQGYEVRSLVRSELIDLAPAVTAMLALGATSWLLLEPLGVIALLPLALATVLPELAIAAVREARSVSGMDAEEATGLYAAAIADVLGVDRRERRALALAARLPAYRPPMRNSALGEQIASWVDAIGRSLRREESLEASSARVIALRSHERYDGTDWPAGVGLLDPAPRSSRILACARAWGALTTGAARMSHAGALDVLRMRAGTDLDPAMVAAAERVVAQEEAFAHERAFEPRLHRLPLPRAVRRGVIPALLGAASPAS
jgi:hypothetical protein